MIDLLREQPDEVLDAMHASVQSELQRLTVELRQIEEAQARRRARRGTSSSSTQRSATNGRRSGVSRRDIYEHFRKVLGPGRSYAPHEVREMFTEMGFPLSANAARNSLARLVDVDDLLERDEEGLYRLPEPRGGSV